MLFPGDPAVVFTGDPAGIKAIYSADPDTFEPARSPRSSGGDRGSALLRIQGVERSRARWRARWLEADPQRTLLGGAEQMEVVMAVMQKRAAPFDDG